MSINPEKTLYWIVRAGTYVLPFTLLIIANSMFFPFISGKNFAFRIVVEVIAAAWAGLLIINFKKYWPKWNLLATALTIFVAAIFISAVFGINFSMSLWSSYERMDGVITQIHLLALFLALVGTFRTRREWFSIFGVSIAVSVLVALYGLLEYAGQISYGQSLHSRIISTLGNPIYVAAYLSFHVFLIIYLLGEIKNKYLKWLLGAVLLFELAIIFITKGRGVFVGLIAGVVIALAAFVFTETNIKKKIIFAFITAILVSAPIFLNVFREAEFIRSNGTLSRFADITLQAGQTRFVIWNMAWEAFKEKPVLGWGSENFIVAFAKYYDAKIFGVEPWYDRTHNMFLEWLVGAGLAGFLAYIFLISAVFWTIVGAVLSGAFSSKQAFIFSGMMVAYLVQLIFVFDTLGTYIMFVFFAGFFSAASSYPEEWNAKTSLFRALKNVKTKDFYPYRISTSRLSAVIGVFVAGAVIVYFVNVRPIGANRALMRGLTYFNQGQLAESYENFQKALKLSKGTVGETEIAEHLAFSTYNLFSSPELLKKPEGENFYRLAKDELEKQVAKGAGNYPNIKHNILLAQLYHQKAVFDGDAVALQKAFENYEKVILDAAPNYVSVYPVYATLLAQTGNLIGATLLTQKASEILESAGNYDARTFYSVPLFYTAEKKYDEAYKALANIAEKHPYSSKEVLDPEMTRNIITTTASHGKDALPFLEKIYELDNKFVSVRLMLAQIHAEAGNNDEAIFYANEALKLDPSLRLQVDGFLEAIIQKK